MFTVNFTFQFPHVYHVRGSYLALHIYVVSFCDSEIKVDCIRVSAIPIKSIIDDHIQRLFDALLGSLRRSIQTDVNEIETYLTEATETLSQRPQSIEEIGDANAKHIEYAKKKKEVSGILLRNISLLAPSRIAAVTSRVNRYTVSTNRWHG